MKQDMNNSEKTQPLLSQEANEHPLQEKTDTFQVRIPVIDERQLEDVTGGGLLDCFSCFGKARPVITEPEVHIPTNSLGQPTTAPEVVSRYIDENLYHHQIYGVRPQQNGTYRIYSTPKTVQRGEQS